MYEIITQNVNELQSPIKKQLDGWKNKTKIYAASWRLTSALEKIQAQVKQWDDIATIISNKVDFKPKKITRESNKHYILIKSGLFISKI